MQDVNPAKLRASELMAALVIERGTTDLPRSELAAAAGLSERTLYRYFPTKQEFVRPILDHGSVVLANVIVQRTDLELLDSIAAGFEAGVGGEFAERTRRLFPLLLEDPALRAVLLQAFHDCERWIGPSLAQRMGVAPRSVQALTASSATLAAIRVALEVLAAEGHEPVATLRTSLAILASGVPFTVHPER